MVEKANFSFQGSSGQSIVKVQSFSNPIADVTLTSEKYTGNANKTVRWKIIGNILEVRCTFWGWGGSSGAAALAFNVYSVGRNEEKFNVPIGDENQGQVFTIDISGMPEEKFEKVFDDVGGEVTYLEIVGQQNKNVSEVEVSLKGTRGFILSGIIKESSEKDILEDTFYVLAQIKQD